MNVDIQCDIPLYVDIELLECAHLLQESGQSIMHFYEPVIS